MTDPLDDLRGFASFSEKKLRDPKTFAKFLMTLCDALRSAQLNLGLVGEMMPETAILSISQLADYAVKEGQDEMRWFAMSMGQLVGEMIDMSRALLGVEEADDVALSRRANALLDRFVLAIDNSEKLRLRLQSIYSAMRSRGS